MKILFCTPHYRAFDWKWVECYGFHLSLVTDIIHTNIPARFFLPWKFNLVHVCSSWVLWCYVMCCDISCAVIKNNLKTSLQIPLFTNLWDVFSVCESRYVWNIILIQTYMNVDKYVFPYIHVCIFCLGLASLSLHLIWQKSYLRNIHKFL